MLSDAELRLRDTASKKILLEVTVLKAIEARNAVSLDAVLKQLNQLRGGTTSAPAPITAAPAAMPRPATKAPIESQATIAAPATPGAPAETPPVSADLATLWTQLVEAVGRVSPFTRSYLVDANPVSFVKNVLVIGFDPNLKIISARGQCTQPHIAPNQARRTWSSELPD